ncbi:MAG TPA: NADP-dependent isocitrate dehydrogenase, partial [Xanthomonadaceae bacterium]|nr:NADP-dependent isocitrate dehydrogenase [Xanthomonadaceae bacterium]
MDATLSILRAADPSLSFHHVTVGLKAYESGLMAGIGDDTWKAIDAHKIILKGPITTPQGGGYKSVNVTLRKTLGLYANLRPCVSYHPYVTALHPTMDVVIV